MGTARNLSQDEISGLIAQGCTAEDWKRVRIDDGLNLADIRFVEFESDISIGVGCVISHAVIRNTVIGSNTVIKRVGRIIDSCRISDDVVIENVGAIVSAVNSTHGVGVEVSVVVESGQRGVLLYPELSAQAAYLQAFCLQDEFRKNFKALLKTKIEQSSTEYTVIRKGAILRDVVLVEGSLIGENARLEGVQAVINSTVNGAAGSGSVVENSIIAHNGYVGVSCIIRKCFVADSAVIDSGFDAENSLFFANSECLRGEGCSVFAGPFTSSHHKSTLLLAGVYSFYTAGSGSNFSNHRFKLGPVHQGVIERGSKTGSSSYLIWPSQIAPFTTVIGKHTSIIDSSMYPYSLLLREGTRSVLLPGAMIFTSGYERDLKKWAERDRRLAGAVDIVNTRSFTPFTMNRVLAAINALKEMKDGKHKSVHVGVEIPEVYIDKALAKYHAAVNYYYGGVVAGKLEAYYNKKERVSGYYNDKECSTEWCDMAGLVVPEGYVNVLISNIKNGDIDSLEMIQGVFDKSDRNYEKYEWEWILSKIGNIQFGSSETMSMLEGVIVNWREAAKIRLELLKRDAYKEYSTNMGIGCGLIGDKEGDFLAIRGAFVDNEFIKEIEKETEVIINRASRLLGQIVRG